VSRAAPGLLNGPRLTWLLAGLTSLAMLLAMAGSDMSRPESVSSMIQFSVRLAVPWLYLVFAASALRKLFPGQATAWLMRNRRHLGLVFAAAMAWQGFFIVWLVTRHTAYYVEEVYFLRDAIEGVVGYLFLAAMTVTSFRPGRAMLSAAQWRGLHLVGIYYLWAYAFAVYWWNLFYYRTPVALDYVLYWAGFLAWALRVAAWAKTRRRGLAPVAPRAAGIAVIGLGLAAASFGGAWRVPVENLITGYSLTRIPELYMPYWPFLAYLPQFVIAAGALLATRARSGATATPASTA